MNLDIEREPKLKALTSYIGVYRGVRYEIKNWPSEEHHKMMNIEACWAHYLIINVDEQLPEVIREKFWLEPRMIFGKHVSHDYMDSALSALEWHGGITFYEKISGLEGGPRIIKAGCDYQHLWDEGMVYDLDFVVSEVKCTIDSLWKLYGPPKARSIMDGKYYEF